MDSKFVEKSRQFWNFALDKRIIYKPYPDQLLSRRVQEPDQIQFGFEGLVFYFPQYLFQHSLPKKTDFELRQYLFNIFNRMS